MNTSLIIGILGIVVGLGVLTMRLTGKNSKKYEAMVQRWGESKGKTIHTFFYIILPLLVGIYFLYIGY